MSCTNRGDTGGCLFRYATPLKATLNKALADELSVEVFPSLVPMPSQVWCSSYALRSIDVGKSACSCFPIEELLCLMLESAAACRTWVKFLCMKSYHQLVKIHVRNGVAVSTNIPVLHTNPRD